MAVLLVFHPRALVGRVVEVTGDLGSRRPRFLVVRDAQFLLPFLQGREQSVNLAAPQPLRPVACVWLTMLSSTPA